MDLKHEYCDQPWKRYCGLHMVEPCEFYLEARAALPVLGRRAGLVGSIKFKNIAVDRVCVARRDVLFLER
jgi:hypothetical protein